jgi:hypothetical protein
MNHWPEIKKQMMAFSDQEIEQLKFIVGPFSKLALNIPSGIGESVITTPHVDGLNYIWGLCCVIGLGKFIFSIFNFFKHVFRFQDHDVGTS